ncbi:MAG: ISAs1 family transposase [Succinivibrio sp.]|nr:ISAs1 family transposase [Succinivibrio sp.]
MSNEVSSSDNVLDGASFLQRIIELNLSDPRNPERIVYPLYVIATVVLLARLSGYENSHEQVLFWKKHVKELQQLIYGLGDEVASEQTIRRVISIIDSNELVKFLTDYFVTHRDNSDKPIGSIALQDREVVAADGQNIRGTRQSKNGNDERKHGGYDVVSLYSSTYGLTLSQTIVDKKNHEAEAILCMLKKVILRNTILTWDSLNTRPGTVSAVVDVNADCVVGLKSNQSTLEEDVRTAFEFVDNGKYKHEVLSATRVLDEHGRIETKQIDILEMKHAVRSELRKKWADVHSVIRVRTVRHFKSSDVTLQDEDRYFISSIVPDGLDEKFAETMLDIILQRWGIEARHWVIDVVFRQDALPLRNKDYITNSTACTKLACNVLSYIRDNVPYYQGKPWSFKSLQIVAQDAEVGFMFLKAFFTQDMSQIENDERFIGLFYKQPEPTGNDVPDDLENNGFQSSIDDDTPLGKFARTRKKIKAKK